MATVDLKKWIDLLAKDGWYSLVRDLRSTQSEHAILNRRVKRLENRILYALKCPASNLCRTCIIQLNEALEEEPDSDS